MKRSSLTLRLLAAVPLAIFLAASMPAAACSSDSAQIFFGFGSVEVNSDGMTRLETFAGEASRQMDTIEAIRIVGHSDRTGPPSVRARIADDRAQAVRVLLMARGIPEGMIRAVGAADRYPLTETADNIREQLNRRVELTIFFKPVSAADLDLARSRQGGSPLC